MSEKHPAPAPREERCATQSNCDPNEPCYMPDCEIPGKHFHPVPPATVLTAPVTRKEIVSFAASFPRKEDADFLLAHDAALRAEVERLRWQLPQGMEHCTIRFNECEKGHGWLTATNWVPHACPTCALAAKDAEIKRLRAALVDPENQRLEELVREAEARAARLAATVDEERKRASRTISKLAEERDAARREKAGVETARDAFNVRSEIEKARADRLAAALREVLPDTMGGYPDLFAPHGGWEAWEKRATAALETSSQPSAGATLSPSKKEA